MEKEEMKFDEVNKIWTYKVSFNGVTVYGHGETQKEAKKNFKENCDSMWE